ncbi:MAG: leucine-rich repeat domain-containing protein [Hormoscilla sp. GM7CHS1pb]|nr:leucine-rich repeat domain-containing protein [Hormoscilla sp. GM7CHS1pb]
MSTVTFGTPQTNPFGLADVGQYSSPTLADLDGDGDLDLFVGNKDSKIIYFKNKSPMDLSDSSISENSDEGAVVGTFSITDPNNGDTFTYQLVSGYGDDDNAAFTIDGDQLQINNSPDFETQSSYSIRVKSTSAAGLSYSENFTINVKDVNEDPTDLDLSNNSIDENVAANTVVGTFSTTDPDTGDSFTYQLVAGTGDTDNAAFTIDGDELQINNSPDFETQSSYSIRVQTTDSANNRYSETFTINVKDDPQLDSKDYQAMKALYESTGGADWRNKKGWDFKSETPPEASIVAGWHGVKVDGNRVTGLMLGLNGLTGKIPNQLGNLSNLERLNLHSNQLSGSIPPELGNLKNLRLLNLNSNQLSGSIPPELGNLNKLEYLYLKSNQLSGSIPPELGNLKKLDRLYMSKNQLTDSIPQEVLDLQADKQWENPPYIKTEIPDVYARSDQNFSLNVSENFGDINYNIDKYTATGLPEGVTINSQGVISGIPTKAGTFTVAVTAIDQARGEVTDTFDIVVAQSIIIGQDDQNDHLRGRPTGNTSMA